MLDLSSLSASLGNSADLHFVKLNKQDNNTPILTIITVVMNDPAGLIRTATSVDKFKTNGGIEYIIWISHRSTQELVHIDEFYQTADMIIQGEDYGIFDAMNRSLQYASGKYILFLNARDIIIEPFNIQEVNGPCLVPVVYSDYFGRSRIVRAAKTIKFGIPYCHQGMILPRNGYHYDASLKYGADYLALLNYDFDWPLPMLSSGLIKYDTTGVSTVNRWESDKWTARVIRDRFGYAWASAYLAKCLLKLGIKRIYDLKCKLFDK